MPALEAHLVIPGTIEVVLIAETGSLAEAKLGECNIRRPGCQLKGAEAPSPERELEQVNALPAHRYLNDAVQLPQRQAVWHLNPPPDHGAEPDQPDLELQNLRSWRRIRSLGFGWGAFRQMSVSRSFVSLGSKRCAANPLPICPTLPHALFGSTYVPFAVMPSPSVRCVQSPTIRHRMVKSTCAAT
jgi:hypothetical protein